MRAGVTGPARGNWPDKLFTRLALSRLGVQVRMITPRRPPESSTLRDLDALVLGGGADVGSDPEPGSRDQLESELIHGALDRELPVLGICRGVQMMNVALGGTLVQDNPHARRSLMPSKKVHVQASSRLAKALGRGGPHDVNSTARHAVLRLGDGLVEAAKDDHGVTQALERPDHPFFVGVQWHPEYLPFLESQRRIFENLLKSRTP